MLRISGLTYSYPGLAVLHDINLALKKGEILCLLGPSGCGKTTLLRVIAGLESGFQGQIWIDERPLTHTPVHRRGVGMMFQDFALFPHLSVGQNVEFGLKMNQLSPAQQREQSAAMLALVGLDGFENRDVTQLSGGEKQRVALARSLAPNPRLLLLDEPLGSLDAALRERLIIDVRNTLKKIGMTAIYVTHDQQEAFAISDQIAVMNAGQIEQIDTAYRTYRHPKTVFTAQFLGLQNVIPVEKMLQNQACTAIGTFPAAGEPKMILLHPDGIKTDDDGIEAIVRECIFRGDHYRLQVQVGDVHLMMKMPGEVEAPQPGEKISLVFSQLVELLG